MQIDPLLPTPLVHGPLIADPRHRRPDRRVQPQRSAHRDAGLALCAIQRVPEQFEDGRTAGDEGCVGGDGGGGGGGGGGPLLPFIIVAAGRFGGWDGGGIFFV